MLSRCWKLTKLFLSKPSKAAEASRDEANLGPNLALYFAFVVASMLFFWLKPFDFPDVNAALPRESQGLGFWFKVMLWQPPLEAAWIVFLLGLAQWLREGKLAIRLLSAVLWTALPIALIAAYVQLHGLTKPVLALGEAACFALFVPLVSKFPRDERLPVASFMIGLNVIGLIMIAPMILSVIVDSGKLFEWSQIAGGLLMVGVGTAGLRALCGMRLPRAFMAVLLSMFFQIALAFALHFLGVVPKEILKALLYA